MVPYAKRDYTVCGYVCTGMHISTTLCINTFQRTNRKLNYVLILPSGQRICVFALALHPPGLYWSLHLWFPCMWGSWTRWLLQVSSNLWAMTPILKTQQTTGCHDCTASSQLEAQHKQWPSNSSFFYILRMPGLGWWKTVYHRVFQRLKKSLFVI